jgi:hypothetical protein
MSVAMAYAIVPDPAHHGRFFSLKLEGVMYEQLAYLEPSSRSENLGSATQRVVTAVEVRSRGHKWK